MKTLRWLPVVPLLCAAVAADEKAPPLITQHGGGGNPEAIVDLDTRVNYCAFGREAVKRGYLVWAPALAMRSSYAGDPAIPGASREQLLRRANADDARPADREGFGDLGHFQAVALICPRPCRVEIGAQDGGLNPMAGARTETDRAAHFYRQLGVPDRFQFSVHPGGHEFATPAILDFFDQYL